MPSEIILNCFNLAKLFLKGNFKENYVISVSLYFYLSPLLPICYSYKQIKYLLSECGYSNKKYPTDLGIIPKKDLRWYKCLPWKYPFKVPWLNNNKSPYQHMVLIKFCKINSLMLYIREPSKRIINANAYNDWFQIQNLFNNRGEMWLLRVLKVKIGILCFLHFKLESLSKQAGKEIQYRWYCYYCD